MITSDKIYFIIPALTLSAELYYINSK